MSILGLRLLLFRWARHWQLDVHFPGVRGWFSFGWCWKRWCGSRPHPVLYWSPDATPCHQEFRGWTHDV